MAAPFTMGHRGGIMIMIITTTGRPVTGLRTTGLRLDTGHPVTARRPGTGLQGTDLHPVVGRQAVVPGQRRCLPEDKESA